MILTSRPSTPLMCVHANAPEWQWKKKKKTFMYDCMCLRGWFSEFLFYFFFAMYPPCSSSRRQQPGALPSERPSMPERHSVTFPPKGQCKQKHLREDLQHKFSTFLGFMMTSSFPTLSFTVHSQTTDLFNSTRRCVWLPSFQTSASALDF